MITYEMVNAAPSGLSYVGETPLYKCKSGRAYTIQEGGAHPFFNGSGFIVTRITLNNLEDLESFDSQLVVRDGQFH